jgi:tetratricopeptide (TPR) repeat protein
VVLNTIKKTIAGFAVLCLGGVMLCGQQQQPQWKDRAEFDLFELIRKEQNPQAKLQLLQQWEQKYPDTAFRDGRYELMVQTYQQLGKAKEMLDTAKAWVAFNPKAISGWYWINLLTVSINDTSPAALDQGEKAAKALLEQIDEALSPAKKPEQVTEEQWKQQRDTMEYVAYRTLGWVAMEKQQYLDADKYFTEALKRNPNDAQVSAWAGRANVRTKQLERQGIALFHFARAAVYSGPGSFPEQARAQLMSSFEKNYINFHGSKDGMDEVLKLAQTTAIPPEGFKIESQDEIMAKQEEELKKSDPVLALWVGIKRELTGPNGPSYFENSLKNAHIPGPDGIPVGEMKVTKLKGTVVSVDPPKRPKKIVLGLSSPNMSEVTLVFDNPLTVAPEPGTVLEFGGVVTEYSLDPFNVTFEVEPSDVVGLPAAKKAAPAVKKAPAAVKKK